MLPTLSQRLGQTFKLNIQVKSNSQNDSIPTYITLCNSWKFWATRLSWKFNAHHPWHSPPNSNTAMTMSNLALPPLPATIPTSYHQLLLHEVCEVMYSIKSLDPETHTLAMLPWYVSVIAKVMTLRTSHILYRPLNRQG
jgi:hypothetical protein